MFGNFTVGSMLISLGKVKMKESISIGSSPYGEDCVQLGSDDYYQKSKNKILVYKEQLIREFGEPPFGCILYIESNPHDFGTYHELACKYDPSIEEAVEYAFKLEGEGPEFWDEISLARLKELGVR
jgi:hypothetical protein